MSDPVEMEPDRHWTRAGGCFEAAASGRRREERVEAFARASRRVRVRLLAGGEVAVERGIDEGLAIRVHRPASGETGFAASSGISPAVAARAAETASRDAIAAPGVGWDTTSGLRRDLRHVAADPPDPERLAEWLRVAVGRSNVLPTEEPWLEVSDTIEAGRHETGGWLRGRRRIWGVAVAPVIAVEGAEPVPRVVAAADLAGLPAGPWPAIEPGQGGEEPSPGLVIVDGDALAALVPALVASLPAGAPVGPGWIVDDDPRHPLSLVGGTCDDAGFPSIERPLADGRRVVGDLQGPGCLLRGSFRDPPEPEASLLVVDPPPLPLPARSARVLAVRLHPLEEGWILEVDGVRMRDGEVSGAFRGAIVRATPGTLAMGCVGGAGPSRLRAGRVLSPALGFEGLRLEEG